MDKTFHYSLEMKFYCYLAQMFIKLPQLKKHLNEFYYFSDKITSLKVIFHFKDGLNMWHPGKNGVEFSSIF